jgi:voltage-gated potassium channel
MKRLSHLALLLGGVYAFAVLSYITAEHHSLGDAVWWAFMTFTTVGYGDQYPHTLAGRAAGMILVFTAVFVVVPTITAIVSSRIIGDDNIFTHEEQEEVKELLRSIHGKVHQ